MTLIDILKTCANDYTNDGNYHVFSDDELAIVEQYMDTTGITESTDAVYDRLYNIALKEFPTSTFFAQVGSKSNSRKVKLPFTMGSMTEAHLGELAEWYNPERSYVISRKLDGCSCGLVYENGVFSKAYSRGDGYEGQDITAIVKAFEHKVPEMIGTNDTTYVRGEIIVPKVDILCLLQELKEETGKTYKNGRNTCAGMLNSKSISKVFSKYAHFVAYHIENWEESEYKMFNMLSTGWGFETPEFIKFKNVGSIEELLTKLNKKGKETYLYEIDGSIVTVNEKTEDEKGFWTGTINPKCSMKYKVGCVDNYAVSTITNIKWQISSYGYFKPVIEIEPVDLDGSTISNVTGNNYKNLLDNHLCIGATVRLHKAGLVIPFIDETISYPTDEDYNLPKCETDLSENGVDLIYEDVDTEWDAEIALQKLIFFCSKLGVEYAGSGNLRRLMEVTDNMYMGITNLICLPVKVFQEAIGVNGIRLYASLHDKVNNATVAQFMDAVSAFGRGIGELKLNKVIDMYDDLPFDDDKLQKVEGWSNITIAQYKEFYFTYINWCKFLTENGISLKLRNVVKKSENMSGMVVVFTGIRDKAMEERIIANGGKIVSSCTKACNTIIAKDPSENSAKLKKGREQGCTILSYEEALTKF